MIHIFIWGEGNREYFYEKHHIVCDNHEVFQYLSEFIHKKKWAVFTCVGAMPDAIQNMWKRIYSEWLPQAAYELISDYDIEFYTDGDNQATNYISEIWIPVKEK